MLDFAEMLLCVPDPGDVPMDDLMTQMTESFNTKTLPMREGRKGGGSSTGTADMSGIETEGQRRRAELKRLQAATDVSP